MPVDPIYIDSALLSGVENSGCVKSASDISYISSFGEPVATDISNVKLCMPDMFKTDPFLVTTSGCCVLDNSASNCADVANVDAEEENNYYMGVRYFDVTNKAKGERKICYTTPIRKKKLNVMELLGTVATDIITLIVMVLIAACYEYWIVYGNCKLSSIKTNLDEAPYCVNTYKIKAPDVVKNTLSKCPQEETSQPLPGVEWYATIPYNLITFLNNGGKNEEFSLSEIVKIPARSFLLGFFYCIILSRILIKGLVNFCVNVFSSYFDTENSRSNRFIAGVVFVIIFMGLFGNIADRFIGELPYMNTASLFLLVFIIGLTIWVPSVLGLLILMASFVGYRRQSYEKYKDNISNQKTSDDSDDSNDLEKFTELFLAWWDWYKIIENFFRFKIAATKEVEENIISNYDRNKKPYINNEDTLDWFFPIRRSKIKLGWNNPYLMKTISNFFNFDMTSCQSDTNGGSLEEITFLKKYWWYLSTLWNKPYHLANPWFSIDVKCSEINEASGKGGYLWGAFLHFIGAVFFLECRATTFLVSIGILIGLCILIVIMNLLWISFIFTLIIFSMVIGLFGNMIAFFYLHLYVIIGFFYIPFSDRSNLFKIIKGHGNILTILFCIIVVLAFVNVLHPTSVGVIGAILGLLIMYKLLASLS